MPLEALTIEVFKDGSAILVVPGETASSYSPTGVAAEFSRVFGVPVNAAHVERLISTAQHSGWNRAVVAEKAQADAFPQQWSAAGVAPTEWER
jgi:hypothetical protein